eukprot:1194606-Prorocentrum_minimum.AAC.1
MASYWVYTWGGEGGRTGHEGADGGERLPHDGAGVRILLRRHLRLAEDEPDGPHGGQHQVGQRARDHRRQLPALQEGDREAADDRGRDHHQLAW